MDVLRTKRELNRGFGDALSQSFEFAAGVAIFFGLGWLVDGWAGTRPLFMIVLTLLAVVGHITKLWYVYDAEMKRHESALVEQRRGSSR